MEVELQIFKVKLAEFYGTNDEKHRKDLNEWLVEFQKSDQSWNLAWQVLQQSNATVEPIYEKLFALNCLYAKLIDLKFFDRFILESDEIMNLGEMLINLCEKFSAIRILSSKCCSCFVVYLLKTMPDIFSDPFKILRDRWYVSLPSILLEVYASLVEEFRNLSQPLPRRNNVRSYLRQNEAFVANCAAELLQKTPVDPGIVQSAIKCVESWISFDGCDLSDWQSIIILCLSQLDLNSGDTIACLAKFFETFVENSQLIRMEKFTGQLFDYAANLINFSKNLDKEDETFQDIARMVSLLSSNHSKILVRLFDNAKAEHSGHAIVNFFLDLSSSPGFYPVDETVSILPVNFWYHFYDEITSLDSSRIEQIFVPFFSKLLEILVVKLRIAPNFSTDWSSNEREQHFYYRQEMSDTVVCCYRILGPKMTSFLLAVAKNAENDTVESILFIFYCIGDYVSVKDTPAITFLTQAFPLLNFDDRNCEVSLKLVGKYCDLIMELDDEITKLKTVGHFVEISVISLQNANFCSVAVSSLHDLCKSITADDNQRVADWLKIMEKIVVRSTECFNNEGLEYHSRLEALTCAGIILSGQNRDAILAYLNALLTPRLLKMQNLFSSCASQVDMSQLLFHFDVITTLIASLKKKSSENPASPTTTTMTNIESPIYLVMAQSLDLFSTILDASRRDEKISAKLCDLFSQCLTCLHLDAKNLIGKMSEILAKIFPPYETAIDVAGKLLLIFSCDATAENVTVPLFQTFLNSVASTSSASAVAAFLAQCTNLVKKAPHFFALADLCPQSTNRLIEISSHCVSNGDTYAAKHGALFLTHYFQVDSSAVKRQVEFYGASIIGVCFARLKTEISTALVNHVADVLFILWSKYPDFWMNWRALAVCQNDCVSILFREINNKMKYRELVRQININCRKGLLQI